MGLGMVPGDVQALEAQITMLMMRADITPAAVQGLRDQITMLMMRGHHAGSRPGAAGSDHEADGNGAGSRPATLELQVTMLMMRADITPAAVQILRADIARLTTLIDAVDTRTEDPTAEAKAPAIADPDDDMLLGENSNRWRCQIRLPSR